MKKISLIIGVCLAFQQAVIAQNESMYTLYMFDKLLVNPAFAGSANYMVASIKNRDQFIGLPNHPSTKTFNFHMPFQKYHLGIGCKIISDRLGPLSTTNAALDLSYHLNLAGGKFSAGFEAGSIRKTINIETLTLNNKQDIAFTSANSAAPKLDVNWGCYYQKKQFYCGYSTYHLLYKPTETTKAIGTNFFIVGNVFELTKSFSLESAALLQMSKNQPSKVDINVIAMYDAKYGVGACYKNSGVASVYARLVILENLRLSYAYDFQALNSTFSTGASHELILSYGLKLAPPPVKKEIHPRYYF